ncbi:MAG TPA: penicillin-binding transpeptidase domain-containing protein, partial [Leptospiraceae bacterium]|nr:penicillin-binding transpeptidase domain-containing protein [Leptospiraceae bacterium]
EKILGFDQTGKHLPREATVALGSVEMTPLEMARAYSVFASGGLEVKPFLIESIKDSDGATLFEHKVEAGRRVLSVGATEIITSMMQDVIKEGTGTAAAIGRPAAGKTGTTNRSTDAWFIGFTPQLVTAVQIGYDSNRTLGSSGTGGAIAAPVWGDYMRRALRHEPVRAFEFPESNVRRVEVCEDTGLLPASSCDTIVELFLPGTEPKTSADSRRSSDSDRQEVKRTREDIFTDKDF